MHKLTLLLLIPLILLSSCILVPEPDIGLRVEGERKIYYSSLRNDCDQLSEMEKGGCHASVKWMEKNNFLKANGKCPKDMEENMNKTRGSRRWCEPRKDRGDSTILAQETKIIKDFGSGFTLSQTDDETRLSYSGKVVKTWLHTPPKEVPFIWDEACTIVWKGFEKLAPNEQSTGKQGVWDALTEKEKKVCMKEYLGKSIRTEQLTERFFEIIQTNYNTATLGIYDTKSGNLQQMPTMGTLKLTESEFGNTIFIDMTYGDDNMKLLYNKEFSKLLSKEEIPKQ